MRISDWSSDVCSSDLTFGIGFDDAHAIAEAAGECERDLDRGAFTEIIDIGLEGEAEAGDRLPRMRLDQRGGAVDDVRDLAVVDLARGADQRGLFGRGADEEPRIDRDAMPAAAGAGRGR